MIESTSNIRHRSISELLISNEEDCVKVNSLNHNPYLSEIDCSLLEYVVDGKVAGQVTTLPTEIVAYSRVFQACGGSGLCVDKQYRGRGIASELTKERMRLSRDKIAIASGLSIMSFPLFKKLGFVTFSFPRLIYLRKSRPVLEMVFSGILLKVVALIVDIFLNLHTMIQRKLSIYGKNKILIEEVSEATEDIVHIVADDNHPFRENHTKEWFDWVLHYPFSNDEHSRQHLFQIWVNGKVQAFFMTKERFHKQASHRGFKNVILGSVIEWGVKPDSTLKEIQICKAAVFSFGSHVDAVEICLNNVKQIKSLKKMGMIHVGDSNMAVNAADDSPFQVYKDKFSIIDNWRIRPACSDNGLH